MYSNVPYLRIILTLLCLFTFTSNTAVAADELDNCNDSTLSFLSSGPRSSPFDPQETNDSRFLVDNAPGELDTYCTFRSGGPLEFDIEVTRAVAEIGDLNADGTLKDADALISVGAISSTAKLTMPAYDVDNNANVPPYAPEIDRVLFNGVEIGFLQGANNIWRQNEFTIPIRHIRFKRPGASSGGINTITIQIDVGNAPINFEAWCTAIDWAQLEFEAKRPVIMVHGFTGKPEMWDELWVGKLNEEFILNKSITVGKVAKIQHNASMIATEVSNVKQQYGVDEINIVAHSKGGLDSREYIRTHNDIGKLIMIGTPNGGSQVATILQGLVASVPIVGLYVFRQFGHL